MKQRGVFHVILMWIVHIFFKRLTIPIQNIFIFFLSRRKFLCNWGWMRGHTCGLLFFLWIAIRNTVQWSQSVQDIQNVAFICLFAVVVGGWGATCGTMNRVMRSTYPSVQTGKKPFYIWWCVPFFSFHQLMKVWYKWLIQDWRQEQRTVDWCRHVCSGFTFI